MEKDVTQYNEKKDETTAQKKNYLNELRFQKLDKKSRKFGRESLNEDAFITLVNQQSGEIYAYIRKEHATHFSTALQIEEQISSKE